MELFYTYDVNLNINNIEVLTSDEHKQQVLDGNTASYKILADTSDFPGDYLKLKDPVIFAFKYKHNITSGLPEVVDLVPLQKIHYIKILSTTSFIKMEEVIPEYRQKNLNRYKEAAQGTLYSDLVTEYGYDLINVALTIDAFRTAYKNAKVVINAATTEQAMKDAVTNAAWPTAVTEPA